MAFNLKGALLGGALAGPVGSVLGGAKDAVGGLLGGGTKTATTTQASSSAPWEEQQPYLKTLFQKAQQNLNSGGPQYFGGNQVAGLTPDTLQGQNYIRDFAKNTAPQLQAQSSDALSGILNAPNLDNNQYFQAATRSAIDPVVRAFNEDVLPQIRRSAVATGSYGDSRMGVAEGIAADRLQQNLLNMTSGMAMNAYSQGQDNQIKGLAIAPQVMQTGVLPGQLLDSVGQQDRTFQQALIDAEMNKWNFQQNAPANNLATYQNLITGNYGGTATGTATTPLSKTNPLMGALGGAAQGAAVGSALGGPGIGTGIGALIGLFGSR